MSEQIEISLPSYPYIKDMWDELRDEKRPIVVYGMGNGADKLLVRLEKYGVSVADFFASDGFVRGHSFHGRRVKSFSEIKAEYQDFVILLSFATAREEVLELLRDIDSKHDMYIPDMPVAGEEYFDRAFYNENYAAICSALQRLADEESRRTFCSVVRFKLTGRMKYLFDSVCTKDDMYTLIGSGRTVRSYLDVGAYNGDTILEAVRYFPTLERATAMEPDPKTYKRLLKTVEKLDTPHVMTVNAAAWDVDGEGEFSSSGNRNSSVSSTRSFEQRSAQISLCRVDSLDICPDYIKYDVEGAEFEALCGSERTIKNCHPVLLVSLYHRSADIFSLVERLGREYPFYRFYLRRLPSVPAWDLNLILIPYEP